MEIVLFGYSSGLADFLAQLTGRGGGFQLSGTDRILASFFAILPGVGNREGSVADAPNACFQDIREKESYFDKSVSVMLVT
jgi:hypothetical protein